VPDTPPPVKRDDYLRDSKVQAFLNWARPLVNGECELNHPRPGGDGKFKTLADAWRGYKWRGMEYQQTVEFLTDRRKRLGESLEGNIHQAFREAATEVLRWGGVVAGNRERLEALGDEAIPLLRVNTRLLDPATADLERVWVVQPMNSGFSKIYSLLLDGFPIYDSRVACALASLVRWFCEETDGLEKVPKLLAFGIPPNQGDAKRDPSCGQFTFPKIRYGGSGRYAQSNVMAAWVLDELSRHGPFGEFGEEERQFALQSAMFMVGERPLAKCGD